MEHLRIVIKPKTTITNNNDDDDDDDDDDIPSYDSNFCLARSFVPNCLDDMILVKVNKDTFKSKAPTFKSKGTPFSNSMGSIDGKISLYTIQKQSSIKIKEFIPKSISFNGVCLIADISGFTKLSSKLCALGKNGVDELQKATNGFMNKLVDSIYEYEGDIIKFAGDAIICTFKPKLKIEDNNKHILSEEELVQEACVRALECTWKLKDHKTQDMTMHIAIGYGLTHLALLGGYKDNWEVLVSGKYMCNLGGCLDEAGVGEIVTTAEFFDIINGSSSAEHTELLTSTTPTDTTEEKTELLIRTKSKNKFCEVSGELTASKNIKVTSVNTFQNIALMKPPERLIMESYKTYYPAMQKVVPLPIIHGLNNSTFDTLAQLREVTTMFMKFDGYDYNDHGDILKLQTHFFEAQKILNESGGFLRQFLVDDKGCVLIGIWGVPQYAHVDNGKRALLTAIEIRERLLDMKMKASFGITTGSVYCGLVGSNIRREYCVIGSVVNLAARLMGKSKGSVLIDHTTFDKLELNAKNLLLVQEPILVKGIATPVTTYLYDIEKSISEVQRLVEVPLRSICKEALNPHVMELVKGKTTFNTLATATRRLSLSTQKVNHDKLVKVNIHIIEGHAGMGSEEIRPWLKKKAEQLNLAMVAVEVSEAHNYSAVKNIFVSLISHDVYYNRSKQSFVVHRILKELYDKNIKFMERVAYPVMRIVFGINVPFKKARREVMSNRSEKIIPQEAASDELQPVEFVNAHICKKVAFEILSYLISERSHILLIEKAHCMDEESWRILSMFVEGTMKAMFIYSQEPISHYISNNEMDEIKSLRNMKTAYLPTAMYEKDLLKHDNVHFLNLPKYSFQETRSHFLYCMSYSFNLPARLDLYVYKLSGGNPFWISHIIAFINEQGVDEFMNIMGNAENKTRKDNQRDRKKSLFLGFSSPADKETAKFAEDVSSIERTATATSTQTTTSEINESFDNIGKLQHFILCRLEKLSLESQEVLREASIVGNQFTESLLYSCVTDALHSKLRLILSSLVQTGWISQDLTSTSKNASYWFCHEVIRDTLYELSPLSLKETLHAKIAEYMVENKMIDNELIAYHFLNSGPNVMSKSFEFSHKAAEEFLQDGLYDDFFRNITNATKVMNSTERSIALGKTLNKATNIMRSTMLANVMMATNSAGYGGTFLSKLQKYFICRRGGGVLIDNTIRKQQFIIDRLNELKSQVGVAKQKSTISSTSSPTRSISFFRTFQSPNKSKVINMDILKTFVFSEEDDKDYII